MRRDVFQAIADPNRRAILGLLATKSLTLNGVARHFKISRPAVSKHVKVLAECGLVVTRQDGRERYCEAQLDKLNEVSDWVEQYRVFWTRKLDALEVYLNSIQSSKESLMAMTRAQRLAAPVLRAAVLTKIYDAPRELVFQAWTRPEHLAEWWGPAGFTNPVCRIDPRVGGSFLIHMRSPDGSVFPCGGEFYEIVENERIVMEDDALDPATGEVVITGLAIITFEDVGNKTKLTVTANVLAVADAMRPALDGMEIGWSMSLDKLTSLLDTAGRDLVTTKWINATPDRVFDAWADPAHLAQWWGPDGFTLTTHSMEFRPGGVWRFIMYGPDGTNYDNTITYIEIERPGRLVYLHGEGREGEPGTFISTVTFEAFEDKTFVTMRGRFPSAADLANVVKNFNAAEGAIQHIANLAKYVEQL